ncbi:MAG: peptidylprolyl isomerase [Anaerolineales bacterium]|nr:peptidylprolyl isomerase [Anaerolineales bacterium]
MYNRRLSLGTLALLLVVAACGQHTLMPVVTGAPTASPTASPAPTATATPLPSATPEPLAARVNGEPIRLAEYEAEVQRCQAAQAFADCPARVLQALTDNVIVEQAARRIGLAVSEAEVQAEIDRVQQSLGSPEAYMAWLAANFYTEETFHEALRRDLLRAQMAARAAASIGEEAEQVHAQVILVNDEALARRLLEQIRAGADFSALAVVHSLDLSTRVAGGDLGWFPRGWLTMPEVEQAAFNLQPGMTSDVIATSLGFYLVKVLGRDPVRALSPEARRALQMRAYENWLANERAAANVEILIKP